MESKFTDPHLKSTDKKGLVRVFELALRKASGLVHFLSVLPMFIVAGVCFGMALFPAVTLLRATHLWTQNWSFLGSSLVISVAVGLSYFVFAISLITIIPFFNSLMRARLKPWRGPYYSFETVGWYVHNGLTYLARYTILELLTPSPFNIWFYRRLGMKIGKHCQVNSTHISDPSLISLGDRVTVGGSVTLVAHYGQGGFLILAPVVIEDQVTLGLKATVMGGVRIGRGAKVLPHSVILPKTQIPEGETWGGVPARKILPEELALSKVA